MISVNIFGGAICILIFCKYGACTCTWPSVYQNSTWWDSAQGELTFTAGDMTGYNAPDYFGDKITSWVCQEETFDLDGVILARSSGSFSAFSADWFTYLCFKLSSVTAVSFTYHLLHDREADLGQQRAFVTLDTNATIAQACNAAQGSSGAEFVTLIKKGIEHLAYIKCPKVLLGKFEFNYTDSSGIESCNDPNHPELMNVCSDERQLSFDTPCSTQSIVYASSMVFCVASTTVGSDTYVQLFNNETSVDNSTTYRFSCMAISSDSRKATIVYRNCTAHQSSSNVPRSHDGAVIGTSISLSPYEFCQTTTATTDENVNSTMKPIGNLTEPYTTRSSINTEPASVATVSMADVITSVEPRQSTLAKVEKPDPTKTEITEHKENHSPLIAGIVVLAVLIVAVVIISSIAIYVKRRRRVPDKEKEGYDVTRLKKLTTEKDEPLELQAVAKSDHTRHKIKDGKYKKSEMQTNKSEHGPELANGDLEKDDNQTYAKVYDFEKVSDNDKLSENNVTPEQNEAQGLQHPSARNAQENDSHEHEENGIDDIQLIPDGNENGCQSNDIRS